MAKQGKKSSRLIKVLIFVPAILFILIIISGTFIVEMTGYCLEEEHAPIKFSSIEECDSYMEKHYREFGHDVACIRTDFPTSIINKGFELIFGMKRPTVDEIIEERKSKNEREIIQPGKNT